VNRLGDGQIGSVLVPIGQSVVISVMAARAAFSSTMALPPGVGGGEGVDGEVVHGGRVAAAGLVDQGRGIVGERGCRCDRPEPGGGPGGAGLGRTHGRHRVPQADALVESGQDLTPADYGT
jgi:hypothetical protein